MKKLFKKFLSVLLIYRMLFTTSAFITFADALNNEETTTTVEATEEKEIADAETTEVEETTTLEETAETEEVVDEETTVAEDTNVPEETTEVEEVVEEKSSEELLEEPEFDETTEVEETSGDELVNSLEESTSSVELESSNEETTEETVVEESTELEETVVLEATESEITKEEIFTAGENYVFKFTMPSQGIPAWFNKIDGPTDIEYNSSDLPGKRVVVPVVYIGNYSGSLAEVYIRVGWLNGGPSGPWCSDEQIDSWVAQWNAGPMSPFDIWANLSKVTASSVKTNPNRTSYSVGEKINSTGLVLNLSGLDFENIPVAYDKPEFEY